MSLEKFNPAEPESIRQLLKVMEASRLKDEAIKPNPISFVALRTDHGRANTFNQDACYYFISNGYAQENLPNFACGVVCDSAGEQGEKRASNAVSSISKGVLNNVYLQLMEKPMREDRLPISEVIDDLMKQAITIGSDLSLTVAVFIDNLVYIGHVGDTRVYFIYDDQIEKATLDRSYIQKLIEQQGDHPFGDLSKRNIILRALGQSDYSGIDHYIRRRAANSKVLMCTPGLGRHVTNDEIQQITTTNPPQDAVDKLVSLANERGGTENITVIIFQ